MESRWSLRPLVCYLSQMKTFCWRICYHISSRVTAMDTVNLTEKSQTKIRKKSEDDR